MRLYRGTAESGNCSHVDSLGGHPNNAGPTRTGAQGPAFRSSPTLGRAYSRILPWSAKRRPDCKVPIPPSAADRLAQPDVLFQEGAVGP